MRQIILGLGSNQHARQHFAAALSQLSYLGQVLGLSDVFMNKPAYGQYTQKLQYINAVVIVSTGLSLEAVTQVLKVIETQAGERQGEICPLDLDIIAFEGQSIDSQGRPLPRPCRAEEGYVWHCLHNLCPRYRPTMPQPEVWELQSWDELALWQKKTAVCEAVVVALFALSK